MKGSEKILRIINFECRSKKPLKNWLRRRWRIHWRISFEIMTHHHVNFFCCGLKAREEDESKKKLLEELDSFKVLQKRFLKELSF